MAFMDTEPAAKSISSRYGALGEEDWILLPNPEIHPLLKVGFLLSNEFVVRDDVVGLHGVGNVVLGN